MIARTERGLLLTCLWYIREVDPVTLLLTGLTRDGVYLVEHGEVVGAVNNFRFNESPLDVLARATEAGRQRAGAVTGMGRVDEPHRHAAAAGGRLQHELGQPRHLADSARAVLSLSSPHRRCVPSAPEGQEARAPTTWLMHAHNAATSSGSMAGNMAMRSWLRPSLR